MPYLSMGQATNDAMRVVMRARPDASSSSARTSAGAARSASSAASTRSSASGSSTCRSRSRSSSAVSVGAATRGLRPVASMSFVEFSMGAMDELVNQAAKLRYMFGGQAKVPFVLRCADGTIRSAAAQHSESLEALFAHIPGLKVVAPYRTPTTPRACSSRPSPTTIRSSISRTSGCSRPRRRCPRASTRCRSARPPVRREGTDVTIIAYSIQVANGAEAAEELAKEGISAEVIDLRTMVPLDIDDGARVGRQDPSLPSSATRPGRSAASAPRSPRSCRRTLFDVLEAPVLRVGARQRPHSLRAGARARRRARQPRRSSQRPAGVTVRQAGQPASGGRREAPGHRAESRARRVRHRDRMDARLRRAGRARAKPSPPSRPRNRRSRSRRPPPGSSRSRSRPGRNSSRPTLSLGFIDDDAGMSTDDQSASARAASRVRLAGWLAIPEPLVVEAAGRAGFDWIGFDLQHGAWDLGTAFRGIQLADALGQAGAHPPARRAARRSFRASSITAPPGIVLAMASEPEVVAAAIERARYQPEGRRSYGGQRYGMRAAAERSRRCAPRDLRHDRDPPRHRGDQARSPSIPGLAGLHVGPTDLGLGSRRRRRPGGAGLTARRSPRSSPPATATACRSPCTPSPQASAARWVGARLRRAGADHRHRSSSAAPSPTFSAARVPALRATSPRRSQRPAARTGKRVKQTPTGPRSPADAGSRGTASSSAGCGRRRSGPTPRGRCRREGRA